MMKRNYKRNQMLVDFDFIPEDIKTKIVREYDNTKPSTRMNMLNYMIDKKLKNLIPIADEF